MKKAIAISIAVLMLAALLAACGNDDSKATGASGEKIVLPTDASGELVYPTDAEGYPVYPTDANGEIVFATDAEGANIYAYDGSGNAITTNNAGANKNSGSNKNDTADSSGEPVEEEIPVIIATIPDDDSELIEIPDV